MARIVVAPQSFKGSLSAVQVAAAIAEGVLRHDPATEIIEVPMADGGEGTVDALLAALGGERHQETVEGPLGDSVQASWALLSDGRAAIEMAAASGLPLIRPEQRDPLRTSSYGTGQLIRSALARKPREIILGIGGSATNDGGAGALQALGMRLLDGAGQNIGRGGAALAQLARIDATELDAQLTMTRLRVMCDVTNPLCGPNGATAVYGPQKGATPAMISELDGALERFAAVVERDLGRKVRDVPGSGAAGGLGAGLLALGASLESGAEMLLDLVDFERKAAGAALVITGEGRLDGQSLYGKTTVAVARRSRRVSVPVLAIVGGIGSDYAACYDQGISGVMPITPGPMTLAEAQVQAAGLIADATARALALVAVGKLGNA